MRFESKRKTHLALAEDEGVRIVRDGLLEVLDLLLVEPGHFGLGELADVLKVLPGIEHLALCLIPKDKS